MARRTRARNEVTNNHPARAWPRRVDPAAPAHDPEVSRVQLGALAHRLLFISQPPAGKLIVTSFEQMVLALVQTL